MGNRVYTPDVITGPGEDEILVFGNNSNGNADTVIARVAREKFGAEMNNSEGLQGLSYSIAVEGVTLDYLRDEISALLDLIYEWDQTTFLITSLGDVEGGFSDDVIAPMFKEAVNFYNIRLPKSYYDIIEAETTK